MFDISVRAKSYLVIILMITCFGLLYPKILHPMVLNVLGLGPKEPVEHEFLHPRERQMRMNPERIKSPHPGRTPPEAQKSRGGGVMTMILPVYAIGIVCYLVYTLMKVFGSDKSKNKQSKRENVLRNYYRDFHFDPNDGEFKMNYSQNNNSTNDHSNDLLDDLSKDESYYYSNPNDIYNCTKSLPHDLELLLQKVDDKNISEDEMRHLRIRLEETEDQLTRILKAMEQLEPVQESNLTQPPIHQDKQESSSTKERDPNAVEDPELFQECLENENEQAIEDLGSLKHRRVTSIETE